MCLEGLNGTRRSCNLRGMNRGNGNANMVWNMVWFPLCTRLVYAMPFCAWDILLYLFIAVTLQGLAFAPLGKYLLYVLCEGARHVTNKRVAPSRQSQKSRHATCQDTSRFPPDKDSFTPHYSRNTPPTSKVEYIEKYMVNRSARKSATVVAKCLPSISDSVPTKKRPFRGDSVV